MVPDFTKGSEFPGQFQTSEFVLIPDAPAICLLYSHCKN